MTVRAYITRSFRRTLVGFYAGVAGVFVAGLASVIWNITPPWPFFTAVVVLLAYFISVIFRGVKCPNCRANLICLFYAPQWRWPSFLLPRDFKFCPACGISFDSEVGVEKSIGTVVNIRNS